MKLTKIITYTLSVILAIVLIYGFLYYTSPIADTECVIKIAEDYCNGINKTYSLSGDSYQNLGTFYCKDEIDFRINPYGKTYKFYYLEEEIESCLIKDAFSLKKTGGAIQ